MESASYSGHDLQQYHLHDLCNRDLNPQPVTHDCERTMAFPGWSFTQARMMSQMTSNGASVFVPSGLACVDETLYPTVHSSKSEFRTVIHSGAPH